MGGSNSKSFSTSPSKGGIHGFKESVISDEFASPSPTSSLSSVALSEYGVRGTGIKQRRKSSDNGRPCSSGYTGSPSFILDGGGGGGGRRTEEDEEDESMRKIEALKKSASKQQKRKDYFYDENFQQNNNSEGQPMSLNIDDQRRLKNWGSGGQNGHQRSRNNLERSDSMFTSSQMNLTRHHQRSSYEVQQHHSHHKKIPQLMMGTSLHHHQHQQPHHHSLINSYREHKSSVKQQRATENNNNSKKIEEDLLEKASPKLLEKSSGSASHLLRKKESVRSAKRLPPDEFRKRRLLNYSASVATTRPVVHKKQQLPHQQSHHSHPHHQQNFATMGNKNVFKLRKEVFTCDESDCTLLESEDDANSPCPYCVKDALKHSRELTHQPFGSLHTTATLGRRKSKGGLINNRLHFPYPPTSSFPSEDEEDDDLEDEVTVYCALGSVCSRRSKATVKSRKVAKPRTSIAAIASANGGGGSHTVNSQGHYLNKFFEYQLKQQERREKGEDLSASVAAYDDIVQGQAFKNFVELSKAIGGDVATQGAMVNDAFQAQRAFILVASKSKKPGDADMPALLKPQSDLIQQIQDFREKNRRSEFFNHLSCISESIPALGWVAVAPAPSPFVKEMNDAGQFYSNRVLKDWKEKDKKHVEWTRSWGSFLAELQAYVKQWHTTGLVWNPKGGDAKSAVSSAAPAAPAGGPPLPPPPPPPGLFDDIKAAPVDPEKSARNNLFAEINKGDDITKGLKKVTKDMQTHKNPELRGGSTVPAGKSSSGGAAPAAAKPAVQKPPNFGLEGKKWVVEYFKGNPSIQIDDTAVNQSVYIFKCEGSTIKINGKVNNVIMDGCKKSAVVFDSVVSSCEFINCQSVQMQVLGSVPTITVEKTDGCQMYLSKDSLGTSIITAKSSEMNVLIPDGDDFVEQPIPEQFKTMIKGTKLETTLSESV